jgi:hypothetical protein
LLSLLALRDSKPDRFESAAVTWHARWCLGAPASRFAQSRAVLNALEMLMGPDPAGAAAVLERQCQRCGRDDLANVLEDWAASHPPVPQSVSRASGR